MCPICHNACMAMVATLRVESKAKAPPCLPLHSRVFQDPSSAQAELSGTLQSSEYRQTRKAANAQAT